MELIKANPDAETLKMFLWIAVSVVTLLLIVIGFFLRRELFSNNFPRKNNTDEYVSNWNIYTKAQDEKWESFDRNQKEYNKQQKEQIDKLERLVNNMSGTIQNMNTVVEVIQRLDNERNPRIEKQVFEHERRLNSHGHELTYIKARIENGKNGLT